jgi:hypothetical protein
MEHAYWYAVLLSMLHCMPLRPEEERLCIMGHAYWYAVLLGLLHCMPLRPERGGFVRRAMRRFVEHAL